MGISDSKELLAFLGTGFMSYTCYWSMVQNAWTMANRERKGGTLEITFISPANRLAMMYGRALGALIQEVWMFCCFCVFILVYTKAIQFHNILVLPFIFLLLLFYFVFLRYFLYLLFLQGDHVLRDIQFVL